MNKHIKVIKVGQVKASKYGNVKTKVDGYEFDSKIEAKRYTQLKMLLRAGKIQHLTLQPEFILQDTFMYQGKSVRSIKYVSDFKYILPNGDVVIEDVKGKLTKEYQIKKKLFLKKYGVEVIFKEIYAKDI